VRRDQCAHFYVVDPMLVLASTAALVAAVHVAREQRMLALGGLAAGWASASKVWAVGAGDRDRCRALAAALRSRRGASATRGETPIAHATSAAGGRCLVAAAAFAAFRPQPCAFGGL
jgi:hypothetical protein